MIMVSLNLVVLGFENIIYNLWNIPVTVIQTLTDHEPSCSLPS